MSDATEQRWRKEFAHAHDAIPQSWLVVLDDGTVWVQPGHRDDPIMKLYKSLLCVGYARGWIR